MITCAWVEYMDAQQKMEIFDFSAAINGDHMSPVSVVAVCSKGQKDNPINLSIPVLFSLPSQNTSYDLLINLQAHQL